MLKTHTTKNETETRAFARRLAKQLKGGDILLLSGELGAGKTTFVQGLAEAFGIKEKIKSPTFVLMRIHKSIKALKHKSIVYLAHCDAYRVKSASELKEVGLMDWLGRPDTIVVVEWGEKIKPLLRGRWYTTIKFQHGKKPTERVIKVTAS